MYLDEFCVFQKPAPKIIFGKSQSKKMLIHLDANKF